VSTNFKSWPRGLAEDTRFLRRPFKTREIVEKIWLAKENQRYYIRLTYLIILSNIFFKTAFLVYLYFSGNDIGIAHFAVMLIWSGLIFSNFRQIKKLNLELDNKSK